MKQRLLLFTYTLFAISCFHNKNESVIEQIWSKDGRYIYSHQQSLAFNKTTGDSIVIRAAYYDIHEEINKTNDS